MEDNISLHLSHMLSAVNPPSPRSTSPQSLPSVERKKNTEDDVSLHLSPKFSVFNPPHKKSINIYFKAVLPMTAWEWGNSSVFIHFMQLDVNIGPGSCTNVDEDLDLLLVEFVVKMHIDVFCSYNYIFYKYAVYSRRKEDDKHPYEYLHGMQIKGVADARFINRALKIDHNKCFPGG